MKSSTIKTRAAALLITMVMLVGTTPAIASAATVSYDEYPAYRPYTGFVPYSTYTPYTGEDFSKEAVYERLIAMKVNFPQGTKWNPNVSDKESATGPGRKSGCGGFALMLLDAAFGILKETSYTLYRDHCDYDKLRVGDYVYYKNNGGQHVVCILAISGDNLTVAEGNYNAAVNWGRTGLTISGLKKTSGYGSGIGVITRYTEDGAVLGKAGPHIRYDGTWTDGSAVTKPPATVVTTPSATPPPAATPAATATPKPTKAPATAKPKTVEPSKILIINMSDSDQRIYMIETGSASISNTTSYSSYGSTTLNGLKIVTVKNSGDLTVTYKTATFTVKPMKSLEIDTATLTVSAPAAPQAGNPAATAANAPLPAPANAPAATPAPAPAQGTQSEAKAPAKGVPYYTVLNNRTRLDAVNTNIHITTTGSNGGKTILKMSLRRNGSHTTKDGIALTASGNDIIVTYKGQTYVVAPKESVIFEK